MVCKINFDYEVSLSDDNDSIPSSNYSSDEENLSKKFVLGDNILNITPLEIISVRQLNDSNRSYSNDSLTENLSHDNIDSQQIPTNSYLCYDESVSNFEEESITDSEYEQEFQLPHIPFKYELPTINRFQIQPSVISGPLTTVSSIGQYCMKEKFRRLQTETEEKTNLKENNIQQMQKSNVSQNKYVQSDSFNTSSKSIDTDLITPEILSNLPIDLLTEFINGEKSLSDILNPVSKETSKRNRKYKTKKRQKMDKKIDKNNKPNNCQKFEEEVIPNKNSQLIYIASELTNENTDILTIILPNPEPISLKVEDSHSMTTTSLDDIHSQSYKNSITFKPQIFQSSHLYNTNHITNRKGIKFKSKENKTTHHHFYQTKVPRGDNTFRNTKTTNSTYIKYDGKEKNYTEPKSDPFSTISIDHEYIDPRNPNTNSNSNSNQIFEVTEKLCSPSLYEEQPNLCSCNTDDCNEIRTSSTDSGFHDIDFCDPSDDVCDNKHSSHNSNHVPAKTDSIVSCMVATSSIDTTNIAVNNFLDLSSFKFKFINESNLIGQEKNPLNAVGAMTEIQIVESEQCDIINNIGCHQMTNNLDPASINDKPIESLETENSMSKQLSSNYKLIDNTDNCKEIISKDQQNVHFAIYQENSVVHKQYNPFKVDYYSPESSIASEEEICQFLNYQWLKFCEKFTMTNHDLMVL